MAKRYFYLGNIHLNSMIKKTSVSRYGVLCSLGCMLFLNFCIVDSCKTADSTEAGNPTDFNQRTGRSQVGYNMSANMLFDFRTLPNLENWVESSDTVREVGMSKASFVLQKTQKYQRAIFFALLNPQENGACFAGYRTETNFDSSIYKSINLRLRGFNGDLWRYKLLLTNQKETNQRSYEAYFNVTKEACYCRGLQGSCHCELDVSLPMEDFKAYYRGRLDPDAPPLSSANVISIGLQAAGGVYEEEKQSGVGAIEIDWIKLLVI